MKQVKETRGVIKQPTVTTTERLRSIQMGLFVHSAITAKIIAKRFGDRGREAIADAWDEFANTYAKLLQKEHAIPKSASIEEFAKWMGSALEDMGSKTKINNLDAKTISIQVSKCARAESFKTVGAPREICNWLFTVDMALATAANPKLTLELTKNIYKGDSYCEYILRVKE